MFSMLAETQTSRFVPKCRATTKAPETAASEFPDLDARRADPELADTLKSMNETTLCAAARSPRSLCQRPMAGTLSKKNHSARTRRGQTGTTESLVRTPRPSIWSTEKGTEGRRAESSRKRPICREKRIPRFSPATSCNCQQTRRIIARKPSNSPSRQ
jgi:hypothetical protein